MKVLLLLCAIVANMALVPSITRLGHASRLKMSDEAPEWTGAKKFSMKDRLKNLSHFPLILTMLRRF